MKNIDEYINATINMQNTSDGGSAAYHFDDGVVLIKYSIPLKYGIDPRKNEELIAVGANKKRLNGVKTPAHLAIKRVQDEENSICWVLQERAKGQSFMKYAAYKNDVKTQLKMQEILLNAPDSHYEKCISDLCELFNMGLELKPKNIFYDESKENGGFTFIDLLDYNSIPLDFNSLKDILRLNSYAGFIYNATMVSYYDRKATIEEKELSKQMYYKLKQKVFMAMEKVIPNFNQHRRWILRSYPKDVLEFFESNGTFVGDLTLNEQEYIQFDQMIEMIIESSFQKIMSGKNKFWQIGANEIRIDLDSMGMQDAWKYHKLNNRIRVEFDSDYDYDYYCKKDLENSVNSIFNDRLELLSQNSTNPYIINAKNDFDELKERNRRI